MAASDGEAWGLGPRRFRKKPVVIDAMRLTVDNAKDVCDWVHGSSEGATEVRYDSMGRVFVETLEGTMRADVGSYVIRGVSGEFYPCLDTIFEQTYEPEADA